MHSSRASVDAVRVGIDFVSHSLPGSTRLCFIGRCSRWAIRSHRSSSSSSLSSFLILPASRSSASHIRTPCALRDVRAFIYSARRTAATNVTACMLDVVYLLSSFEASSPTKWSLSVALPENHTTKAPYCRILPFLVPYFCDLSAIPTQIQLKGSTRAL